MRTIATRWFLALAIGTAVGCAASARSQLEELRKSIQGYNEAYRWKNYQRAAAFLPADLRPAFLVSYEEDDKSLHIEGYQILAVNIDSPERAKASVRYRFMQLPSVTLEHRVVIQHWAKVNERWVLEHEDDPIRRVDTEAPGARGFGGSTSLPPAPTMEVESLGPGGTVIERGPGTADEPSPEERIDGG